MTDAAIVHVIPSRDEARVFLAQARRFAEDGSQSQISSSGRQLLLHQACIAACDAVLVASGFKIEGSDGGHVLRLEKTADLLGLDGDFRADLDEVRLARGRSAYRAGLVLDGDVQEAGEVTRRLIDEATRFVDAED